MEEQETQKINIFARLTGVITSPATTFEDIRQRPDYLLPIILMILTSIIAASIITPIALEAASEQMSEMPPEAMDRFEAMRPISYILGMVGAVIAPLVVWLIMTALIHVISGIIGGEGEFKPLLSTLAYAGIPGYLKAIVMAIVVLITNNPRPKLGLDIFFEFESTAGKIIGVVLSNIEILNLWYIGLVIVGISVAKQISRKQAIIPWIIWWIILTAIQSVGAIFQGAGMPAG